MTATTYNIGQRVKVLHCPGLDGEQEGVIVGFLEGGCAVEVTGFYYCGTNSRRQRRTETNFVEEKDIQPST
jgi:hypothetical protein